MPAISFHLVVEDAVLDLVCRVARRKNHRNQDDHKLQDKARAKDVSEPDQAVPSLVVAQSVVEEEDQGAHDDHPSEVDTVDLTRGHWTIFAAISLEKAELCQVVRRVVDGEGGCDGQEDELGRGDQEDVPAIAVRDIVSHFLKGVHLFYAGNSVEDAERYPVEAR